jgi:transcriptional regulator with XRE-family HTH domain
MEWAEADWGRLGSRIRAERERQGVSRKELAERAGVSAGSVQSAEKGAVPKGRWPQSLGAIERALGWVSGSMRSILEGGDVRYPAEGPSAATAMSEVNDRFAGWLKKERRNARLSQAVLADRVSRDGRPIYQQTIAKIEQGERGIELDLAVAIASVFGATPDVALGLTVDGRGDEEIHLRGMLARREAFIRALSGLANAELEHVAP